MRNLVMTAFTGVVALSASSVAFGNHVPVGQTFDNRGQCERAIAQARNDARRDSNQNAGDYNKDFDDSNFFCMKNADGTFTIVNGPDED